MQRHSLGIAITCYIIIWILWMLKVANFPILAVNNLPGITIIKQFRVRSWKCNIKLIILSRNKDSRIKYTNIPHRYWSEKKNGWRTRQSVDRQRTKSGHWRGKLLLYTTMHIYNYFTKTNESVLKLNCSSTIV